MISLQYDYLRPVYYLVRWRFYEEARYQLNDREFQDAKVFFNAMQHLSDDEKQILSDVYRKSPHQMKFDPERELYMTVKPVKDKEACGKYGLSALTFANKRRKSQDHLKLEMQNILREVESIFMFRATPKLYLIESQNTEGNERYLLGNISEAKVFQAEDVDLSEIFSLNCLGFEKVPVMPHQLYK